MTTTVDHASHPHRVVVELVLLRLPERTATVGERPERVWSPAAIAARITE